MIWWRILNGHRDTLNLRQKSFWFELDYRLIFACSAWLLGDIIVAADFSANSRIDPSHPIHIVIRFTTSPEDRSQCRPATDKVVRNFRPLRLPDWTTVSRGSRYDFTVSK